ncbi:hypothetical protein KC842_01800, partial [Candidatus Nomurabacteria bacterium]|nr:hypothetical protein [Candidatus Nomurabacteria bacterium]
LASMGTSTPYQEAGVRTVDKSLAMNLENTENPTRDNYVPKYVPNTEDPVRKDRTQVYEPDPTVKETKERNNFTPPPVRETKPKYQTQETRPRPKQNLNVQQGQAGVKKQPSVVSSPGKRKKG